MVCFDSDKADFYPQCQNTDKIQYLRFFWKAAVRSQFWRSVNELFQSGALHSFHKADFNEMGSSLENDDKSDLK